MRRMRTNEWWDDRLDDIAVLRAGLNARGIDGTDAQIAEAYAMWSDKFYAAGWMSISVGVAPQSFVGWVEREWLAPASGEPSGAETVVREALDARRLDTLTTRGWALLPPDRNNATWAVQDGEMNTLGTGESARAALDAAMAADTQTPNTEQEHAND